MRTATRKLLAIFGLIVFLAVSAIAQSRIQLVQGRRPVKEKTNFVVDVSREKTENPRYANAPEDVQISVVFADRPATGMVYLDGKALGRFDESQQFDSNPIDISYGRHTITVEVANEAILGRLYVTVRGGRLMEILDAQNINLTGGPDVNARIVGLERRVQQLENEIAALKKKKSAH